VIISYALQIILGTAYGLCLLVEDCLLPTFGWRQNTRTPVARVLKATQQKALWSQLLFCFTINFATCVRNLRSHTGVFESSNIYAVMAMTYMAFALTLAPMHRMIERKRFFLSAFSCCTLIYTSFAFVRISQTEGLSNIFKACNRNIKKGAGALGSHDVRLIDERHLHISAAYFTMILIFIVIWFILWLNESIVSYFYG
jgi:hypothetical protein